MSATALPRLLRALTSEPLAVHRPTFDAFMSILRARGFEGLSFDGATLHAELEIAEPRPPRSTKSGDAIVEVVPLIGVIANRGMSMATGASDFARRVRRAGADGRVAGIALDIESPGGTIGGVPEAAQAVYEVRALKPVVAVSNDIMASAAYWIGSAATEVVASPSSETGSIGVFTTHEDWSGWLENEGVKITEISAGRFKTEGAPWKPLDEEAMAFVDARVQEAYDWFVRDVSRFRGVADSAVRNGFGEGRVLGARAAKAAGLVDRIATLDEVIDGMLSDVSKGRQARRSAISQTVEHRKRARQRGAA
jgi:signal peptide peptidase SppA